MTYNLTFMDNATSLTQIVQGVNTESDGLLFGIILLVLFVIMLMVFREYPFKTVLLGAGSLISLLAGIMFGMGVISVTILVIPLIILAFAVVLKLWE